MSRKPLGDSPIQSTSKNISPLSIRGTNYYPKNHPWPGLWRSLESIIDEVERELSLAQELHINTLRIFATYDLEVGLVRESGIVTRNMLRRFDRFLRLCERHGMKTIVTLADSAPPALWTDFAATKRYIDSFVKLFRDDEAILMWDIQNEPGGDSGPCATPQLRDWLRYMHNYVKEVDPNHLTTVGVAWQVDELYREVCKPDVAQYHEYAPEMITLKGYERAYQNIRVRKKIHSPLIVGEFGMSTHLGEGRQGVSEDVQDLVYRNVLQAVEDHRIAGACNWCLCDYSPSWVPPFERRFGVLRDDYSLKPAGRTLQKTYARWQQLTRRMGEP